MTFLIGAIMLRLIVALCLIGLTCPSYAESNEKYLVDFILFENKNVLDDATEQALTPPILLPSKTSIPLALGDYSAQPDFRNLPISQSELRQTFYALSRSEDYQLLARYTWQQPSENKRPIDLPPITHAQWHIKGRLNLAPGRFPFLTTNLLISDNEQTIALRHSQPLKLNQTYYLDHPLFGILIRLTPIKKPDSQTA